MLEISDVVIGLDNIETRKSYDVFMTKLTMQKFRQQRKGNRIKILNQAGLGSLVTQQPAQQSVAQQPQQTEQQRQMLQAMAAIQQNPYGNISAMFGGNNNNNNSSNQLMNMLPLIMAQGGQNGQNSMSPEVIQAMMMNAMMPDLNFSSNSDNR